MKTIISRVILAVFIALPALVTGQTKKITGTVTAFNTYPLSNVTVKAKKAKTEVTTDKNGAFEIEIKEKDILQIRESVFLEYKEKVDNDTEALNINLIFENTGRNAEIASEAGYISREDLKYGLEHLAHENNIYENFVSVYDAIKYAIPESTIITENGQKGIQFRGPMTVHGSNSALILVDGVIVDDVSFLNPIQIVSIRRLSSSEASLYGARGGNGVISIVTR